MHSSPMTPMATPRPIPASVPAAREALCVEADSVAGTLEVAVAVAAPATTTVLEGVDEVAGAVPPAVVVVVM
jgi:hypothetical protein